MAEDIKIPVVGPTKSSTEKADALDAAVPNPDDWCIPAQIFEHIRSSKLYPVEAIDYLQLGITFSGGFLELIPNSNLQQTYALMDSVYVQVRWFYSDGPYDSDLQQTYTLEDSTYIQVRWFYTDGPYDSDLQQTYALLDGTYESKLVEADTPDEELQMALAINNTCTMDLI